MKQQLAEQLYQEANARKAFIAGWEAAELGLPKYTVTEYTSGAAEIDLNVLGYPTNYDTMLSDHDRRVQAWQFGWELYQKRDDPNLGEMYGIDIE